MVSLAPKQLFALQVSCQTIGRCKYDFIVYITTTHEALDALLTTVTVTTDLQTTVVGKYLQLKVKPER